MHMQSAGIHTNKSGAYHLCSIRNLITTLSIDTVVAVGINLESYVPCGLS